MELCLREGLLGVYPKSHKCPTSVRNEKAYEYISMDMKSFGKKAQKQNHKGLSLKWTISYQCG